MIGRTGSGKSAIVRVIDQRCENVIVLDPNTLAFTYLTGSNVLEFFTIIRQHMAPFYKALWKHILTVTLIKLVFDDSETLFDRWLHAIPTGRNRRRNRTRDKSLEYVKKFEGKFWQETESYVKQIETTVRDKIQASSKVAAKVLGQLELSGQFDVENDLSARELTEVQRLTRAIVNPSQLSLLHEVIKDLNSDKLSREQREYFICIDDLDSNFVDSEFRYEIIAGLLTAVHEMNFHDNVKILCVIRTNLYDLVDAKSVGLDNQREKLEATMFQLKWSEQDLKSLVEKRLNSIYRKEYQQSWITVNQILPTPKKKMNISAWGYIVSRTLMRPRDLLVFFNAIMDRISTSGKVTWTIIYEAEKEYSNSRFNAIVDEYKENYGRIDALSPMLAMLTEVSTIRSLHDSLQGFVNDLQSNHLILQSENILSRIVKDHDPKNIMLTLKRIIDILIHVDLIEIKWSSNSEFSHEDILTDQIMSASDNSIRDKRFRLTGPFRAKFSANY